MVITFCGHSKFRSTPEYEKKLLDLLNITVGDQSTEMYLGGYGEFDNFAYMCCIYHNYVSGPQKSSHLNGTPSR